MNKILKLDFYLTRKKYKVNQIKDYLLLFFLVVGLLAVIPLINCFSGKYKELLLTELMFFSLVSAEFIIRDLADKVDGYCLFFGIFDRKKVSKYFLIKNYLLAVVFASISFLPTSIKDIKIYLVYLLLLLFIYALIIISKRHTNKFVYTRLLAIYRISLCWGYVIYNEKIQEILINLANISKISFLIALLFILLVISISLLASLKEDKDNRIYYRVFINSKRYISYNLLYLLRSGKLIYALYMFFITYFFSLNEPSNIAFYSYFIYFAIIMTSSLLEIYKGEKEKYKILFSKEASKMLILEKTKSLIVYLTLIFIIVGIFIFNLHGSIFLTRLIISTLIYLISIASISQNLFLRLDDKVFKKYIIILSVIIALLICYVGNLL